MRHFEHLRKVSWEPEFKWVGTMEEATDLINVWHEDYPERVERTDTALRTLLTALEVLPFMVHTVTTASLRHIHGQVFDDVSFRGDLRGVEVRVGEHRAPLAVVVPSLMDYLEKVYDDDRMLTLGGLQDWYWDFNTIHPFQDGNGRVSGIILAAYSNRLEPDKGWLAPLQ